MTYQIHPNGDAVIIRENRAKHKTTDEYFQLFIEPELKERGLLSFDKDGNIVFHPDNEFLFEKHEITIGQEKRRAKEEIDKLVGKIRKNKFTDIPGQDILVVEKELEAKKFVEKGCPQIFPKRDRLKAEYFIDKDGDEYYFLAAEVKSKGFELKEAEHDCIVLAARRILQASHRWKALNHRVESLRLYYKDHISIAPNKEKVIELKKEAVSKLNNFL